MNKFAISLCGFASISSLAAGSAPANSKPKPEIGYYLAKTNVAVVRSGTITSCPKIGGEKLPTINWKWTVVGEGTADVANYVHVDISNGFLVKRSTAFTFHPNGTLASFNSTSEGQGAAVVQSIFKAASVLIPLLGVNPSGTKATEDSDVYCRKEVIDQLTNLAIYRGDIKTIEDKVIQNSATAADLALMERRKQQRDTSIKALTLNAVADFSGETAKAGWTKVINSIPALEKWFTNTSTEQNASAFDYKTVEGLRGYKVCVTPAFTAPPIAGSVPKVPTEASKQLFFRRPLLANVGVAAQDGDCGKAEALEPEKPLLISQWGQIEGLTVGSGNIFGSRQAAAKFDAFGTPLDLSYGSDSGSAGIAGSIDAASGIATAIHGSEAAALDREIKLIELRKKLADLKAAEVGE
jgi:hypothetical protein